MNTANSLNPVPEHGRATVALAACEKAPTDWTVHRTARACHCPWLSPLYMYSAIAVVANGARTLVRRMVGRRRVLEFSQHGFAVPAFLEVKSRAPDQAELRGRLMPFTPAQPSCILARASCLWLILLLLFSRTFARADDLSNTFDHANKLYEEGKFAEAAAAYEKMLRQGQASPALYFNLGNAFFKAGQIG